MTLAAIDSSLLDLVEKLGELRDATPVDDSDYDDIQAQYRAASDLAEQSVGKLIDDGDGDYGAFLDALPPAMEAIRKATKKIEKLAKVVKIVGKTVEIAGKVVAKV